MSLQTIFGILFETDASKAKREIDSVDKSLNKTESTANSTTGSVDDMSAAVDGSADSFTGLADGLGLAIGGLVAVTGLFVGVASSASKTDEIGKFSEAMGFAIENVDAWGSSVELSGGSAEGFRSSLEGLNGQLTDISLTGGGEAAEVFARLGVNAVDSGGKIKGAFDVLPELADSFQRLSKEESIGFGKKLGLDQGTILLLQQGRVAVEDLVKRQKELGTVTEEDYQASAAFNDQLHDTIRVFGDMSTKGTTTILPLLTKTLKGFEVIAMWMRKNKTVVSGFFIGAATALTAYYLPAILSVASATLVAIAPFIAIGAAVVAAGAAFAILYEDVVAYLGGQQSFIGDLANKYEWFGKIVTSVIDAVKFSIKEGSKFIGEMFSNISAAAIFLSSALSGIFGGVSDEFGELGLDMNKVVDTIISIFSGLGDAISMSLGFIASPVEKTKEAINDLLGLLPDVGAEVESAFSGIKSFFGFGDSEVDSNLKSTIEVIGTVDNNPLNGQTSASIINSQQSSSRSNNFSFGDTNVQTQATSNEGVAAAVNGGLNDQISMAIAQLDDAEAY